MSLININNLPPTRRGIKNDHLHTTTVDTRSDVVCLNEPGRYWRNISPADAVPERFRGFWKALHASVAYNTTAQQIENSQPGGAITLSVNQAAHRAYGRGYDDTGLGRWAWTRYRGKNGASLRIVSAYRPCLNKQGATTVYSQHRRFLDDNNDDRCPRVAWLEDLQVAVRLWKKDGDQIILAADVNQDVRSDEIRDGFRRMGLTNLLMNKYGDRMPATYIDGSDPIDGLWGTPGITMSQGGMLPFNSGVIGSDHRLSWIDVTYLTAFGTIPPVVQSFAARRLHLQDKRAAQRFRRFRTGTCPEARPTGKEFFFGTAGDLPSNSGHDQGAQRS